MGEIISIICKYIYAVWNNECSNRFKELMNVVYSKWLRNAFAECGKNVFFERAIILKGGKYIYIGCSSVFNKCCILTAWDKRRGQQFFPKIVIGNGCHFGEYNHITCINSINIGDGLLTGRWVTITDNSHGHFKMQELEIPPSLRPIVSKGGVSIGKNVWIGDKATILPNVNIGDGVVVAANSVVTTNIPSNTLVAGIPARIIKQIR